MGVNRKAALRIRNIIKPIVAAILLLAVFAVVVLVSLSILAPVRYDVKTGDVAPVTIRATREVLDEITAEILREEAMNSVQPIYSAEGRVLLARAVAPKANGMGLGGTKVGVIATTDDAGAGLLAGVKRENEDLKAQLTVQEVEASATDFSAAVNVLKNAGCDVVIACMNQNPLATLMNTMRDVNYNVNVVTSYVNASATTLGAFVDSGAITDSRMVYCTAWLDVTTEAGMADYTTFYTAMSAWELANGESGSTYALNSYAMAGYIAGSIFVQALQAVDKAGLELNYANFAKIMEETEFSIPMGGTISYAGGDRLGVTALALNCVSLSKNDAGVYALTPVSPILSLADVVAATK